MIDRAFIRAREGFSLKGYVPDPEKSQSGVTVAMGYDVGQRSQTDLIGLPMALRNKLYPYLHLRGPKAVEQLRAHPLEVTPAEAEILDGAAYLETLRVLNGEIPDFTTLPDAVQTICFSVCFQYGSLKQKCPVFHGFIIRHAWSNAIAELRDFGDAYPARRNAEADYLEEHMGG